MFKAFRDIGLSEKVSNKQQTSTQIRMQIDSEMAAQFHYQMRTAVIGTVVCMLTVCVGFYHPEENNAILYTWFSVMLALTTFRIYHTNKYPSDIDDVVGRRRWELMFPLYLIPSGMLWGATPFLFGPLNTHQVAYLSIMSCGIIAGGINSLSRRLNDYILFTLPIGLSISYYNYTSDLVGGKVTGVLLFIFLLANIVFARNTHNLYRNMLTLRFENLHLIEKLQNQTKALKIEKNKAEQANTEKSRFLASASHDLRQPLHSLGLYLGALQLHLKDDDGCQILKKSNKSLKTLDDLFSSLLKISQLDAGDVDISPVHFKINSLLENLKHELDDLAKDKGVLLSVQTSAETVFCDPILLSRSLRNLLMNALQHSHCTALAIKSQAAENGIEIFVSDNGKGIPKEAQAEVFKHYSQLGNSERDRRKGLGLGLAIVKRLAELQAHELQLESSENNGSRFSLLIPEGIETEVMPLQSSFDATVIDKENKILVIDDELDILDSLGILLEQWQQHVRCASSIESAQQEIKSGFKPDLIISDYRMQHNKTGMDVIAEIADMLADSTQIVFVTGDTSPIRIQEARKTGFPLLHKPLQPQLLKTLIRRLNNNPQFGALSNSRLPR